MHDQHWGGEHLPLKGLSAYDHTERALAWRRGSRFETEPLQGIPWRTPRSDCLGLRPSLAPTRSSEREERQAEAWTWLHDLSADFRLRERGRADVASAFPFWLFPKTPPFKQPFIKQRIAVFLVWLPPQSPARPPPEQGLARRRT